MRKDIIVNAILGGRMPPTFEAIEKLERAGLMYFSGNHWLDDWSWSKDGLEKLSEEQLLAIYEMYNEPS